MSNSDDGDGDDVDDDLWFIGSIVSTFPGNFANSLTPALTNSITSFLVTR